MKNFCRLEFLKILELPTVGTEYLESERSMITDKICMREMYFCKHS